MSVKRQYFDSEILLKLGYKEITYWTKAERKTMAEKLFEGSAK
jgi:hypothetical protein